MIPYAHHYCKMTIRLREASLPLPRDEYQELLIASAVGVPMCDRIRFNSVRTITMHRYMIQHGYASVFSDSLPYPITNIKRILPNIVLDCILYYAQRQVNIELKGLSELDYLWHTAMLRTAKKYRLDLPLLL